jgi:hypothetical protein
MKIHGATTSARCTAQGKSLWWTLQLCFLVPVTHFASQARTTSLEKAPRRFLVASARHQGTHNIPRQHLSVRQVAPGEPRNVQSWKVNRGILWGSLRNKARAALRLRALAHVFRFVMIDDQLRGASFLCAEAPQMIFYEVRMEMLPK